MKTETRLHIAVADLLGWILPPSAQWTTFNAGNVEMPPKVGRMLKAMGLQTGWPDIQIVFGGAIFGLELKAPKGKTQASQDERFPLLRAAGMRIAIARSTDDVLDILREWQIPTRIAG